MSKSNRCVPKIYRIMWDQNGGEVRRFRLETAVEACERYDVAGFEYDLCAVRCTSSTVKSNDMFR